METGVEDYQGTRALTARLCEPLSLEDYVVQAIPEASPAKWHLAHTTWFYETFLLLPRGGYQAYDPRFTSFFNSYYNAVSEQVAQDRRGVFSRPTVEEVYAYRSHVDDAMERALREGLSTSEHRLLLAGLNHEQQHQELLLTDIKAHLHQPPFFPRYAEPQPQNARGVPTDTWTHFPEAELADVGADCDASRFVYDNETPRHRASLVPFSLRNHVVTCGEYEEFIADGGYERCELWLSDGWLHIKEKRWQAPAYWHSEDNVWFQFTLRGLVPLAPATPVNHVSYYEADAFARWKGVRLPTECEWEYAESHTKARAGALLDDGTLQPHPASVDALQAMIGNVWEWTSSAYCAYPGYKQPPGAMGEYNGKFMGNQMVLRGGSCATPASHIRPTYRNFFHPEKRWQFTGIRLARDLD